MAHSEPEGENCSASPTKWVLLGHSLGSAAIEKVGELSEAVLGEGDGDAPVFKGRRCAELVSSWAPT